MTRLENEDGNEYGLTLTEAAQELGVSRNSLKKRCDRNTIVYFLDSKGSRRIPFAEIKRISDGLSTVDSFAFNPLDYDPKFDIPKAEIWGSGLAPLIRVPQDKQWFTVMGVNDIHVPWHDATVLSAVIELASVIDPDIFVFNGDTNDFFGISRYNRSNERQDMLQTELNQGKMVRRAFRERIPNADMHEVLGNHEERLLTYPGFNAPVLKSLDSLKPQKLMGLDELDITLHPTNGFRLQEDFLVEHGCVVRGTSGGTAKARLDATLISGVMGHTHRADTYGKTGYRDLQWAETGCLCMLNPDYVNKEANWKQAFWIGQFSTKTGNFNVQLIKAVGRGFIFDGKHYGNTTDEQDIWAGANPNFEIPSDFKKLVGAR